MVAERGVRGAGVVRDAGRSVASVDRGLDGPTSRSCARPGCSAAAQATLRFAYADRDVVIVPLGDERQPQTYDLCGPHAARTRPPSGWTLRDLLSDDPPANEVSVSSPQPLGGRDRVALLAAALDAAAGRGDRERVGPSVH